jgi:hypothetical protein
MEPIFLVILSLPVSGLELAQYQIRYANLNRAATFLGLVISFAPLRARKSPAKKYLTKQWLSDKREFGATLGFNVNLSESWGKCKCLAWIVSGHCGLLYLSQKVLKEEILRASLAGNPSGAVAFSCSIHSNRPVLKYRRLHYWNMYSRYQLQAQPPIFQPQITPPSGNSRYINPPLQLNEADSRQSGHGTNFIGQPIYFSTGPYSGRTIRMELHEIQKAQLGRK